MFRRIIYNIKTIFNNLFNKTNRKIIKEALLGRHWDYEYLLRLELAKLRAMEEEFKKFDNPKYKRIRLAANLLQKYLDDDCWTMEYLDDGVSHKFPQVLDNIKYVCKVYVNQKNARRFAKNLTELTLFKEYPGELYQIKLWKLYCLIRERYLEHWWD